MIKEFKISETRTELQLVARKAIPRKILDIIYGGKGEKTLKDFQMRGSNEYRLKLTEYMMINAEMPGVPKNEIPQLCIRGILSVSIKTRNRTI